MHVFSSILSSGMNDDAKLTLKFFAECVLIYAEKPSKHNHENLIASMRPAFPGPVHGLDRPEQTRYVVH